MHKNFKNCPNNVKLSRRVILCDTVPRKNIKLGVLIASRKNLLRNELSCSRFHDFYAKRPMLWLESGIVCDNVPILCTHVYHGTTNNVAGGSFPFRRIKNAFSLFRLPKPGRSVKQPPSDSFRMEPNHLKKILEHLTWTIS